MLCQLWALSVYVVYCGAVLQLGIIGFYVIYSSIIAVLFSFYFIFFLIVVVDIDAFTTAIPMFSSLTLYLSPRNLPLLNTWNRVYFYIKEQV